MISQLDVELDTNISLSDSRQIVRGSSLLEQRRAPDDALADAHVEKAHVCDCFSTRKYMLALRVGCCLDVPNASLMCQTQQCHRITS